MRLATVVYACAYLWLYAYLSMCHHIHDIINIMFRLIRMLNESSVRHANEQMEIERIAIEISAWFRISLAFYAAWNRLFWLYQQSKNKRSQNSFELGRVERAFGLFIGTACMANYSRSFNSLIWLEILSPALIFSRCNKISEWNICRLSHKIISHIHRSANWAYSWRVWCIYLTGVCVLCPSTADDCVVYYTLYWVLGFALLFLCISFLLCSCLYYL